MQEGTTIGAAAVLAQPMGGRLRRFVEIGGAFVQDIGFDAQILDTKIAR